MKWQECSSLVHFFLALDNQRNYGKYLRNTLDAGIPVLVYSGTEDYICNWMGGESWTNALVWRNQEDFEYAEYNAWHGSDGSIGGEFKQADNFTFMKVFDAGHMVPMD